ncbi:MAG: TetR/AcrR family transcriptional regulator, partial [Zetaproteobacteria bacterium]
SRILDAAERRFVHYGYEKATMAEIGGDLGMSAANLYRFFPSKEALLVAVVERQLRQKLAAGLRAARRARDPLERLEAFLLARLRVGYRHAVEMPHFFDLLRVINERHLDLLRAYEARVIKAIARILAQGAKTGRFAIEDIEQTAYDIHQATLRYNSPLSLRRNPLERLEEDLKRFLQLLDRGLAPRTPPQGGKR